MNSLDSHYVSLLEKIIADGTVKETRSGLVKSIFGYQIRIKLSDGFPLLTTKKMYYNGIIHELLWFLSGSTNIKYLVDNNVHIWDDDAYRYYKSIHDMMALEFPELKVMTKDEFISNIRKGGDDWYKSMFNYRLGDLGNVYGKQWRSWSSYDGASSFDQIGDIITKLKNTPDDRRIILSSWNVADLGKMALPPCHVMCQFYTREISLENRMNIYVNGVKPQSHEDLDKLGVPKRELSCMFFCRSQDVPLGTPFNIASYALLTHMIAQVTNMTVGELIYNGGDCHIYMNQMDGVMEQLCRDPHKYSLPALWLNPNIKHIDDFTFNDVKIVGYESYPAIKMPLSVG